MSTLVDKFSHLLQITPTYARIVVEIYMKMGCNRNHSHMPMKLVLMLGQTTFFNMFSLLPLCSGVIGSGLAIFSKHRINDTFLYRYSLNGYPYMVSRSFVLKWKKYSDSLLYWKVLVQCKTTSYTYFTISATLSNDFCLDASINSFFIHRLTMETGSGEKLLVWPSWALATWLPMSIWLM